MKHVMSTCVDCGKPRRVRLCLAEGVRRCKSCGQRRIPLAVRERAALLRTRGYTPKEIALHLSQEGHHVSRFWVSEVTC